MKGYVLNPNKEYVDIIINGILKRNGHCPCRKTQDDTTLCPCDEFVKTGDCKCNLFVKVQNKKEDAINKKNTK